jgi:hypothetical protein
LYGDFAVTVRAHTKVTINRYAAIAARLGGQDVQAIINSATQKLEDVTRRRAARRSGAMRASVYRVTSDFSNYSARASEARGLWENYNGRKKALNMLPELPRPPRKVGIVAVGARHGIFVQFGTRRMAARPFLPSYEEMRAAVLAEMLSGIKRLLFGR